MINTSCIWTIDCNAWIIFIKRAPYSYISTISYIYWWITIYMYSYWVLVPFDIGVVYIPSFVFSDRIFWLLFLLFIFIFHIFILILLLNKLYKPPLTLYHIFWFFKIPIFYFVKFFLPLSLLLQAPSFFETALLSV